MNNAVKLRAFGKANLSLNITGADAKTGLHRLDSVMMSVDCFDTVTVVERDDEDIRVRFVNDDIGDDNTAAKAARAVQKAIGGNGWDITVEKGIPIGAGLGGSSADGAAVLRALDVLYKLPERGADMRALALSVGSDVPFMLTGGLARVRGVGDDLFFMENKLRLFIVGVMCGTSSTARAYAEFDRLYPQKTHCPTDNDKLCEYLLDADDGALGLMGNALYAPVAKLLPDLEKTIARLESFGAAVNMTGSGGMALGYFTDMQKFCDCVGALRADGECRVFAPTRTGVLHERITV